MLRAPPHCPSHGLQFPFLCLLSSGGHNLLLNTRVASPADPNPRSLTPCWVSCHAPSDPLPYVPARLRGLLQSSGQLSGPSPSLLAAAAKVEDRTVGCPRRSGQGEAAGHGPRAGGIGGAGQQRRQLLPGGRISQKFRGCGWLVRRYCQGGFWAA
jgi:hypothetical protein